MRTTAGIARGGSQSSRWNGVRCQQPPPRVLGRRERSSTHRSRTVAPEARLASTDRSRGDRLPHGVVVGWRRSRERFAPRHCRCALTTGSCEDRHAGPIRTRPDRHRSLGGIEREPAARAVTRNLPPGRSSTLRMRTEPIGGRVAVAVHRYPPPSTRRPRADPRREWSWLHGPDGPRPKYGHPPTSDADRCTVHGRNRNRRSCSRSRREPGLVATRRPSQHRLIGRRGASPDERDEQRGKTSQKPRQGIEAPPDPFCDRGRDAGAHEPRKRQIDQAPRSTCARVAALAAESRRDRRAAALRLAGLVDVDADLRVRLQMRRLRVLGQLVRHTAPSADRASATARAWFGSGELRQAGCAGAEASPVPMTQRHATSAAFGVRRSPDDRRGVRESGGDVTVRRGDQGRDPAARSAAG